jgi:hypothetical protein
VIFATLSAAVALTSVSAAFSIDGLTAIFAGAFWSVIAMGMALEVGKLVATAWLRENWRAAPWALRTGLAAMIAVLMALNAVGVFGFLTRAHLERQLAIEVVAADRAAEIDARLLVQGELLADLDRRIRADNSRRKRWLRCRSRRRRLPRSRGVRPLTDTSPSWWPVHSLISSVP